MVEQDSISKPQPSNNGQPALTAPRIETAPRPSQRKSRKFRWTAWIIIALLVLGGVYAYTHRSGANPQAGGGGGRQGGAGIPVPVVAGIVIKKDLPIYLDGLGTVQALNTVTVHARVDGQLENVAFVEGQDVKTGDLLAIIDPAPFKAALEQAQAKQNQDQAQYSNAKLDLDRYTDLVQKKVIASQQFDTQKALVAQLEATVKTDAAAVESAKVNLDYTSITSPIDGRTGIRLVDQGNIVHAADAGGLVVITQLHPISLIFTLPEQTLTQIHEQTAAGEKLAVLAVDRDNQTKLAEGELSVIDNQIDVTTGTIKLKATFPNDDLKLWPGQFINARLHLTTRKDGLVVPASVIQRGPTGPYAFVIKEDQTVELRPVKVAQIEDGQALLDDGLQAGEHIVVDGQYKLQPGSKVSLGPPGGAGAKSHGGKPGGGELK